MFRAAAIGKHISPCWREPATTNAGADSTPASSDTLQYEPHGILHRPLRQTKLVLDETVMSITHCGDLDSTHEPGWGETPSNPDCSVGPYSRARRSLAPPLDGFMAPTHVRFLEVSALQEPGWSETPSNPDFPAGQDFRARRSLAPPLDGFMSPRHAPSEERLSLGPTGCAGKRSPDAGRVRLNAHFANDFDPGILPSAQFHR